MLIPKFFCHFFYWYFIHFLDFLSPLLFYNIYWYTLWATIFNLFFYPSSQDDGILVIPTVADPPLKRNSKKAVFSEFHDRAFTLLSIASMSGCCQVTYCCHTSFHLMYFSFLSFVDLFKFYCQVTVPLGKHEDFPISVSFIAFHGADKFLLDTVLDMYPSLQEQASITSNSLSLPDTNGDMDASELLKEKVCYPFSFY